MQPQEVGVAVLASPRPGRVPVVEGAALDKAGILTTRCVFVYKVRNKIPKEEIKLEEALATGVRREASVGSCPSIPVSLCPPPAPCPSRLTKQIQAKFCYYQ